MEFKVSKKTTEASRHIEKMGEKLIFIEIALLESNLRYNYHVFYRNAKKPPLDLAINPKTGCITYISFFLQDDNIYQKCPNVEIHMVDNSLKIHSKEFSINNIHIFFKKEFNSYLTENAFYYIDKNNEEQELIGYYLSEDSYILMDQKDIFVGVYLNNISNEEKEYFDI